MTKRLSGDKSHKTKKLGYADWKFVSHTLTADDKLTMDREMVTLEGVMACVEQLVNEDYKISIAGDAYNACITASVACRDTDHSNYGHILTGRAPSAYDALRVVVFKHFALLGGVWPTDAEGGGSREKWE